MRLIPLLFALALGLGASQAHAVGQIGLRLGTGTSSYDGDADLDITPFAVGAAWRLSIVAVELEVDALYWKNTATVSGADWEEARLALPVMGKFSFPLVPMLMDLSLGGGLEPRFLLSAELDGDDVSDNSESMVLYLPLVAGVTLDLKAAAVNVELRYERQLTSHSKDADGDRVHQVMAFGGVFF